MGSLLNTALSLGLWVTRKPDFFSFFFLVKKNPIAVIPKIDQNEIPKPNSPPRRRLGSNPTVPNRLDTSIR
ncbi:hypothetical protein PRUPE_8G214200 [Prunus persica]|uniref:Uncharacterized protein n=1 Tax=Prunus persica TaxID=3760 RepID=A0A251N1C4_PRUPE|nr:hypothetical protein PRUPE_8G214200 [Prunus persica]ONH93117.1 hypothetical protein PRUPE_8G214200 [Prunus persica]ONH93118.1 hypothetical protein PRUPE_8G214200 [Prunus persica]